MIELLADPKSRAPRPTSHDSFQSWRAETVAAGLKPIISVTGSRGKTTVVRLLESILTAAGLEVATRTNVSVRIRGRRQRGEIAPWNRALQELDQDLLDVAVEETDWFTLHTMRLEASSRPVFAITNICGNRDACLVQGDSRRAIAALPAVFRSVHPDGVLVINGDDLDVSREDLAQDRPTIFVGLNRESPGLRSHLTAGSTAAWLDHGALFIGDNQQAREIAIASELDFALFGHAGFQLHNALTAAAIAESIGIDAPTIERGLQAFDAAESAGADGFQLIDLSGVSVLVDRPNPSWFLRAVLRAIRDIDPNRVITVVGKLEGIPSSDVAEVGRLLGRVSSLFVAHSEADDPDRSAFVRQGVAMNPVPPVIVHTKSEGRAMTRALEIARPGDLVLVLADRPGPLSRSLRRGAKAA
jgi:cyanophycin synthetase